MLFQLPEAADSVRKIGFEATIFLIVLLALLASFGLIFRWLLKKIDKKDDQVNAQADARREDMIRAIDARREDVIKVMDARREDMAKMESAMRMTADALEKGASSMRTAFDDLAREVRRK